MNLHQLILELSRMVQPENARKTIIISMNQMPQRVRG